MTAIAVSVSNKVEVVESFLQMTLPAAEAISAGQAVRLDTSTGKFTKSNGTSTGEARIYGIATKTVAAGEPLTAIRKGVLDGYALASLNFDAKVFLSDTDGTLADAAGTVEVVIGRVIPATGVTLGTAYDKVLFVDL